MNYDSYEKWRELTLEKKKLTVNTLGITFERKKACYRRWNVCRIIKSNVIIIS